LARGTISAGEADVREARNGPLVFVVERCIAAGRAAGTVCKYHRNKQQLVDRGVLLVEALLPV